MLANRIQHLKDEIARSARRTKEASLREKDISRMKKVSTERRELAASTKLQASKREIVEEGYFGIWVPGGSHLNAKKVEGMKKAEIMKLKAEREAKERKERAAKIEAIKKKRIEMIKAKKAAEEKRLAALKAQYKKKMEAERAKRKQAEATVSRLEEEEARLIEMLKSQQDHQRSAYESLQSTILGSD